MKRIFLTIAAVFALSGTTYANALEEQAKHDPALAEAIKDAKAHGDYGGAYQSSQRNMENVAAYVMQRDELHLRLMGMTPSTAHKGIWAALHKPRSACAGYIRQLMAKADAPPDAPAQRPETIEMLIMSIERSGTC